MILTTTKNLRRRLLGLMREYDDGMVHSEKYDVWHIDTFPAESLSWFTALAHIPFYA